MTAPFFGDFDVEDAYDTVSADPDQVGRKLHGYRVLVEQLAGHTIPAYDELSHADRDRLGGIGEVIVEYAAAHDPDNLELSRTIHGAARLPGSPMWDLLPVDHKRLAIALAGLIAAWMQRQGSWR